MNSLQDRNPFGVRLDHGINRGPGRYYRDADDFDLRQFNKTHSAAGPRTMSRRRFNRPYDRSSVGPCTYFSEIIPRFRKLDPRISQLGRDDIAQLSWITPDFRQRNDPGPAHYQREERPATRGRATSFPRAEPRPRRCASERLQLHVRRAFKAVAVSPVRSLSINRYCRNFGWNNLYYSSSRAAQLDNGVPSS